jgi:BirA family biotin operon repressor/biotin-[acetyl-CoA-carboxylase] ligase
MNLNRILRETIIVEVERHAELVSTNDRCAERAKLGANKLPLLVIADRQTAGRGRAGNRWWTGQGSLAFSLLLPPEAVETRADSIMGGQLNCRPNVVPLVSLAAGLSVVQCIQPLLRNREIGIRWPNDVIVAGRKMAGILVEVLATGHAVIGVGINTNTPMADAPPELASTATTLVELTGAFHDHVEILIALIKNLEIRLGELKRAPAQIAADTDAICLQRGQPLKLQTGNQTAAGICRGIAPDGALLLESAAGIRPYYSGTII